MKCVVENAIEEWADKNQSYPSKIEINQKDFEILEKEELKEFKSVGKTLDKLRSFRGCKIIINNNLRKVRVS